MNLNRRAALLITGAAAGFCLALGMPASASMHTIHPNDVLNVDIGNNNGAGPIFVTDKNGTLCTGCTVSGSAHTGNPNQIWDLRINTSACGDGRVHNASACPFTPGSGRNTEFDGDQILTVCLHAHPSFCMAQSSVGGGVHLDSPSGTGTNWISDNLNHLVGRVVSDANNSDRCLSNDGTTGDQLSDASCGGTNARIGWELNG